MPVLFGGFEGVEGEEVRLQNAKGELEWEADASLAYSRAPLPCADFPKHRSLSGTNMDVEPVWCWVSWAGTVRGSCSSGAQRLRLLCTVPNRKLLPLS